MMVSAASVPIRALHSRARFSAIGPKCSAMGWETCAVRARCLAGQVVVWAGLPAPYSSAAASAMSSTDSPPPSAISLSVVNRCTHCSVRLGSST